MLEWLLRGVRARPDHDALSARRRSAAPIGYRGHIEVLNPHGAPRLAGAVPDRRHRGRRRGRVTVDRGRCILCGECVAAAPERFRFADASRRRPRRARARWSSPSCARRGSAPRSLGEMASALRRSIHVRHVDAGSDGAEEWEIQALRNPYYDIQRLGFFFTAAPRHADMLLVTGGVTAAMRAAA